MSVFLTKLEEALEAPDLPEEDEWGGNIRIRKAKGALDEAGYYINNLFGDGRRGSNVDPYDIEAASDTLDAAEELIGELGGNYNYQQHYARAWENKLRDLHRRLTIIKINHKTSLKKPSEYWKLEEALEAPDLPEEDEWGSVGWIKMTYRPIHELGKLMPNNDAQVINYLHKFGTIHGFNSAQFGSGKMEIQAPAHVIRAIDESPEVVEYKGMKIGHHSPEYDNG